MTTRNRSVRVSRRSTTSRRNDALGQSLRKKICIKISQKQTHARVAGMEKSVCGEHTLLMSNGHVLSPVLWAHVLWAPVLWAPGKNGVNLAPIFAAPNFSKTCLERPLQKEKTKVFQWLLCLICLLGVSWWLSGSSSRCHGIFCGLWFWYFLNILTYYFYRKMVA